jgi:hypothetical protein
VDRRDGEAFVQQDVGGEAHAAVESLEQIVAEQRVVGDTPFEAAAEGVHVARALAHVDAAAEQSW